MKAEWLDRALIIGPYITLVLNEKQFHKAMSHCQRRLSDHGDWIKSPHSDATVHFLENQSDELCCIVALRVKKKTDPNGIVGLLIHESVHIWQAFKRRIGEDTPSDEFEAYAIQTISQRLISAYSNLTTNKQKKKR